MTVARKLDKLGMRSSDTAQIFFDDVRVPQRYLIGEEGMGFPIRWCSSRRSGCGPRRNSEVDGAALIDETIDYTRSRKAFGQPSSTIRWSISGWPSSQTEVEAAARAGLPRLRELYLAGDGRDAAGVDGQAQGRPAACARSPTPACSTGAAWASCTKRPSAARFRDGRLASIGGGADEIMLTIICKLMGTLPGTSNTRQAE